MRPFDLCILSAANETQAQGYRTRLNWRKQQGLYPHTDFMVLADPEGRRIGSGGSTLFILRRLYELAGENFTAAFSRKRILIIHSGGDSRRLPAYAACGKIFTPLPTRQPACLFDIAMNTYAALPSNLDGQVLIASGDVLLSFSAEQLQFADRGITGIAYPDDAQVAGRHGVFVPSRQAYQTPVPVKDFLQKPSSEELVHARALDYHQRAWVDTGIVHLAPDAVEALIQCRGLLAYTLKEKNELNLYQEIPFALLGKKTLPDSGRLQALSFHVSLLAYCGFFHIGRSREFLYNLYTLTQAGALHGFENGVRSNAADFPQFKKTYIYHSLIDTHRTRIKSPVLIENCHLRHSIELGGDNIVTNLSSTAGPVKLEANLGLTLLPLKGQRWTALLYGLADHLKTGVKPENNLFMNQPIAEWLQQRSLDERALWPKGPCGDLWNAQLFPICLNPAAASRLVQSLQSADRCPKKWLAAERRSLRWILQQVDHCSLLQQEETIEKAATLRNLRHVLTPDSCWTAAGLLGLCTDERAPSLLALELEKLTKQNPDLLFLSRLYWLRSQQVRSTPGSGPAPAAEADRWLDLAFSTIRRAVGKSVHDVPAQNHSGIAIRSDEVVWACSPARLDFAGGWSDTPPYCMEQGGAVLNAAVLLNGQYPIQVIAKVLQQPVIRINSIDLGASAVVKDLAHLRDFTNPSDWLSLPKAALIAAGIFSGSERTSLSSLLKKYGGGIDLTLFSALPAGSGLGASSILGAATIAALSRTFGLKVSQADLFQRTSYLEQLMTTGGGWQDQIGGVVGGVKLIQTPAGYDQTPTLSWTQLDEASKEHTLLYYTGLRRMAKNILRQVVSRYLDRDPEALRVLARLKSLALEMKSALDHRQVETFGELIGHVWECNKQLDQGSSTEVIEALIRQVSPHVHGVKLLGAGGGGFLLMVAKSRRDRDLLRQKLIQNPPNARARFFDFAVDSGGLRVNVL